MNNTNDLLTRKALAEKLGIKVVTVYRLQKKGLPVILVGRLPRYDYDSVLSWLQMQKGGESHD